MLLSPLPTCPDMPTTSILLLLDTSRTHDEANLAQLSAGVNILKTTDEHKNADVAA
jgi:hypothetical protein